MSQFIVAFIHYYSLRQTSINSVQESNKQGSRTELIVLIVRNSSLVAISCRMAHS